MLSTRRPVPKSRSSSLRTQSNVSGLAPDMVQSASWTFVACVNNSLISDWTRRADDAHCLHPVLGHSASRVSKTFPFHSVMKKLRSRAPQHRPVPYATARAVLHFDCVDGLRPNQKPWADFQVPVCRQRSSHVRDTTAES